jgi:hypothetical protein
MPAFEQDPLPQATLSQEPLPQEPLPAPAASAAGSGPGHKRKRGGQPGNGNALRHGFYSRRFTRQEVEDLENALREGLQDEITLLRVQIRRLADVSGEETDQKGAIQTLTAIGLGCTRLARMVRAQRALGGGASSDAMSLSEALDEVLKVWVRR